MRLAAPVRAAPDAGAQVTQAGEVRSVRVESLRALAALTVLASHGPLLYSHWSTAAVLGSDLYRYVGLGGNGVLLFFVLTGYLLFWPFAQRDFGNRSRVDLRAYARNRALRILPLYYFVLITVMVLLRGGGRPGDWILMATFSQDWVPGVGRRVDGPMWSLVTELHFYLLLPLLAYLLARLARGSLRRAGVAVALLGSVGLAIRLEGVTWATPPSEVVRWSLAANLVFFAAGMLLALLRVRWERTPPTGRLVATDVWLAASAVLWLGVTRGHEAVYLAAPASFLLIGACVLPLRQGHLIRALEWRPLAAVGVASYSLYLWHVPIMEKLSGQPWATRTLGGFVFVSLTICLALAFASYATVEAPFLRLRRRWGATAAPAQPPATAGRIVTSSPSSTAVSSPSRKRMSSPPT